MLSDSTVLLLEMSIEEIEAQNISQKRSLILQALMI